MAVVSDDEGERLCFVWFVTDAKNDDRMGISVKVTGIVSSWNLLCL